MPNTAQRSAEYEILSLLRRRFCRWRRFFLHGVRKESADCGYDGYYDDVLPSDAGKLKEGPDMELVKKVSAVAGVMLLIVILCVVAMYLL